MIYADNEEKKKMSDAAINRMTDIMNETWGNPSSLYAHGQKAKEVLEEAREEVAAVIGAEPREIIFTSGGSEADNQAILSAAELGKKKGKKHVTRVQNMGMCCRMLYSRAYHMAEASGLLSVRLDIMRC